MSKIILLVATGAFAVSITFYTASKQILHGSEYLILSWTLLALAIILNAIGYYLSRTQASQNIEKLNQQIVAPGIFTAEILNNMRSEGEKNKLFASISCINHICIATFIFGIISLVYFASYNIYKQNIDQKSAISTAIKIQSNK